jgi:hypothetical protein
MPEAAEKQYRQPEEQTEKKPGKNQADPDIIPD